MGFDAFDPNVKGQLGEDHGEEDDDTYILARCLHFFEGMIY